VLETVDVGRQSIDCYEASVGAEALSQLKALAEPLNGARILHLNATPYGGGVAEILRSEVPLLRDLGIAADWKLITGDEKFFSVTKTIHNGLQGGERNLSADEQDTYLDYSTRNAKLLRDDFDVVIVHDPQPLALLHFGAKGSAKWIWRCHIDTSQPNPQIWRFLEPYVAGYDAAVFTLGSFVPPKFPVGRVEIIPPAIDPESPKNFALERGTARRLLQWIGVDLERPLITQISRFDPWKDPMGVIAAYRLVKHEMPDMQLALVGSMAWDDPEGWKMYQDIRKEAQKDPEIHVFTNLTGVGNIEVNAFQRLSQVVIQKSVREGFGLVVSEATWKGTPVVAGRAGGIPLQLQAGAGGFLVDSIEQCAEQTLWLLRNPEEGQALAAKGRELVRQRFLLPRLIADELRLCSDLLGIEPAVGEPAAKVGLSGEYRDPVCGMHVDPTTPFTAEYRDRNYYFCSESCRHQFEHEPKRFARQVG